MKLITARPTGMCEGVRNAVQTAMNVSDPRGTVMLGQLVHNADLMQKFTSSGFKVCKSTATLAEIKEHTVLVSAHGISMKRRSEILNAGKAVIDATCPLVERLRREAGALEKAGAHVVILGRRGHPEIEAVTGDLCRFSVVQSAEEACCYKSSAIGIVSQTTMPYEAFAGLIVKVKELNPESKIYAVETICPATAARRKAVERLSRRCGLVIVVGGTTSNNTAMLFKTALAHAPAAKEISNALDLNPRWFMGVENVGIAAGASTPDFVIEDVKKGILECKKKLDEVAVQIDEKINCCLRGAFGGR